MNAYTLVREANLLLGVSTAVLFVYMDRRALRLLRQGLLSRGEFLGKLARVLYMLAGAYGTFDAVQHDKPAGPYVVLIFVSVLLLTAAAADQARDSWQDSNRRKKL